MEKYLGALYTWLGRDGNGAEISCSCRDPASHWGKILAPRVEMQTGTGTGVNFHLVFIPASPLREISPFPFSLFRPQLGKNLPFLLFLDFSCIIFCNLCIVKLFNYNMVFSKKICGFFWIGLFVSSDTCKGKVAYTVTARLFKFRVRTQDSTLEFLILILLTWLSK